MGHLDAPLSTLKVSLPLQQIQQMGVGEARWQGQSGGRPRASVSFVLRRANFKVVSRSWLIFKFSAIAAPIARSPLAIAAGAGENERAKEALLTPRHKQKIAHFPLLRAAFERTGERTSKTSGSVARLFVCVFAIINLAVPEGRIRSALAPGAGKWRKRVNFTRAFTVAGWLAGWCSLGEEARRSDCKIQISFEEKREGKLENVCVTGKATFIQAS